MLCLEVAQKARKLTKALPLLPCLGLLRQIMGLAEAKRCPFGFCEILREFKNSQHEPRLKIVFYYHYFYGKATGSGLCVPESWVGLDLRKSQGRGPIIGIT